MNARVLIDSIVQQTTILIAQLATSGGLRAPLAHVASQVFVTLAQELEQQGVPKRVSADMFGVALRTYQRRTQRLSQSQTDRGRSLWEALYEYIAKSGVVTREEVLRRFRRDDEASIKGVLRDLTESGIVFVSGTGRGQSYRLAREDELSVTHGEDALGLEALVWSLIYREKPITLARLLDLSRLKPSEIEPVLASLVTSERIESTPAGYVTHSLVLGLEDPAGWEASVLDHFTTVVRTIGNKLALDQRATLGDEVGGSTYHFVLWRGHPMEEQVTGELRRFRERMSSLREEIVAYNTANSVEEPSFRVDCYYGQTVSGEKDDDATE